MKVCNKCNRVFEAGDTCPHCLDRGEGEIRDYHYLLPSPAAPGGSVEPQEGDKEEDSGSPDDEDPPGGDPKTPGEPLTSMSRTRLSQLAGERGLATSGTRAEILARLQAGAQG